MRLIGHLPDESNARTFSNCLHAQGIANSLENDKEGWAIWIHSEDELTPAREQLASFRQTPDDPRFSQQSREGQRIKELERQDAEAAKKRHFDADRVFRSPGPLGLGWVTSFLIFTSAAVTLMITFEIAPALLVRLFLVMEEVRSGQVWRLVTPIFIHANLLASFGFLHLLFNCMWMADLGSMVEHYLGTWKYTLLVLTVAILSNLGEWMISDYKFGGMSGVVYGLLGYVWMKSKFDPASGIFLHQQTVTFMIIWLFMGIFHIIPNVANAAHGVGLAAGMAWGYAASLARR